MSDEVRRKYALEALYREAHSEPQKFQNREFVSVFEQNLDAGTPELRALAAGALGSIGTENSHIVSQAQVKGRLYSLLEDDETAVRAESAWALSVLGVESFPDSVVEALLAHLNDEEQIRQGHAIAALETIVSTVSPSTDSRVRDVLEDEPGSDIQDSVIGSSNKLLEYLSQDESESRRIVAEQALVSAAKEKPGLFASEIETLTSRLAQCSERERHHVLYLLSILVDDYADDIAKIKPQIIDLLSPDEDVRHIELTCDILAGIGDAGDIPKVNELATSVDEDEIQSKIRETIRDITRKREKQYRLTRQNEVQTALTRRRTKRTLLQDTFEEIGGSNLPEQIPQSPRLDISISDLGKQEEIEDARSEIANFSQTTIVTEGNEYQAVIKDYTSPTSRSDQSPSGDEKSRKRAQRESNNWEVVDDHDNIVSVLFVDEDADRLILEYMDGGRLADRLETIDMPQALWICSSIADALIHAHSKGTTHLDVTPSNILFQQTEPGRWDYPKLTDWDVSQNLARNTSRDRYTREYAAPEIMKSNETGEYTDVYMLAATLYAMLTGDPPFSDRSRAGKKPNHPENKEHSIPKLIGDVIMDALEPNLDDRYSSMVIFQQQLIVALHKAYDLEFFISHT